MPKHYLDTNVYDAALERVVWTFDNFEKIYLSFSAGKDSTVMLHMVMDEAVKRGRTIGVLIVDLEGQYRLTMEHADKCIEMYKDNINLYHVCLPISLRNAVSVYEPKWICWDKAKKDAWIREMPSVGIDDEKLFPFFEHGMEFEDFVPAFGEWYSQGERTACLVGIRSDESLNRFRTIASKKKITLDDKQYTTLVTDNVYNVYPIYDMKTKDIWIYHYKNQDKPHNRLYDMMHLAGLPLHNMRICQPYGDDQRRGLWLFHVIEPETWARVVARVNGANGGALYNKEWGNINGFRKVTKPEGHTWRSFSELFLQSLPAEMREHYQNKIILYEKWHVERGYPDGMPDEAPYELEVKRLAPSWRRVCKSLLKNDYWCKGLGFSQHKNTAYKKYLDLMKRRKEAWGIGQGEFGFINKGE